MAQCSVNLHVDSKLLCKQLEQLKFLIAQLPKRRSERFARKAHCLFVSDRVIHVERSSRRPVHGVSGYVVQIRVPGMDELIAAAMRASR